MLIERHVQELEDAEIKASGPAAAFLANSWAGTLAANRRRRAVAYSPEVVFRRDDNQMLVITVEVRGLLEPV